MWAIAKIEKKKINIFKEDINKKLGKNCEIYMPKMRIQIFYKNKIKEKIVDLLDDYIFFYHKGLKETKNLNYLKYTRGLKYFLSGFLNSQHEIQYFIDNCKKFENDKGSITENIFDLKIQEKYKFASGPFTGKLFKILELNKNKINVLIGDFKTQIDKKKYLFSTI